MQCFNCMAVIDDDALFCPNCAFKVSKQHHPQIQTPPNIDLRSAPQGKAVNRGGLVVVVVVGVVLLLALTGILLAIFVFGRPSVSRLTSVGFVNYYPLDENLKWEYQVVLASLSGNQTSVNITVRNFPARDLNGKRVIPQEGSGLGRTNLSFLISDSEGVCTYASQATGMPEPQVEASPQYQIKYPTRVGTSWDLTYHPIFAKSSMLYFPMKLTIEGVNETVTVPAGTFNGCVKIHGVGNAKANSPGVGFAELHVETYSWLAPDVGLVKHIIKEQCEQ